LLVGVGRGSELLLGKILELLGNAVGFALQIALANACDESIHHVSWKVDRRVVFASTLSSSPVVRILQCRQWSALDHGAQYVAVSGYEKVLRSRRPCSDGASVVRYTLGK